MNEDSKDIKSIFADALEKRTPQERAVYLDKVCGNDAALRAKVEALLKAHDEAGDFLEAPAFDRGATVDQPAQIEGPGTRIGHYELLELIGEGGMGLVYLAEQKEPVKRRVALKIIKPGMDSKQVIARFEAERQALALLEHPNIAHVFDAGTTETGRPYFVMEYVKGLSVTRYCDERKLNIQQRLRLFEQVCEGVHHAHQKGIIHRDIKPSNILVSIHGDRAVPKIIDFGIAKAITQPLTDKTFVTFQGQLLGTPEYMSPEQVDLATQDIDTRSDIYSLGVVLYELLAGVLPFEKESLERAGFEEMQRTIRELEPASPSIRLTHLGDKANPIAASRGTQVIALARRLHRELEWIPLKAMRKDRCRRYRSASELADDVRNYLNGLPLIAGPETAIYRMRKFVHKHAGSVATVALVAVAIVLGLVVSTAMYFRAEAMRVQAEQAREKETVARTRAEQAEEATKQKAEDLRRTLYVNSIQLADAKYREGNIRHVRELLESCPNDLRGWEWNRLDYIFDQSIMTIRGHQSWVNSVAISPDGKRIASGSADKTVKVWDVASGVELMTLRGHKELLGPIAFSPDGKCIASGSQDKTLKMWDATSGKELMTLRAYDGTVISVGFSPDSSRIVSGSYDKETIKVWDAATGSKLITIARPQEEWVQRVMFSPDGGQIASCGRTIKVWDATNGTEIVTVGDHTAGASSVAFSPDGKRIVSYHYDGAIKVSDAVTGDELMTLHGHKSEQGSVAFSPDGRRITSGSWDGTIRLWDATTGKELVVLRGHEGVVCDVVVSPDGRFIVSGGGDNTIRIWDTTTKSKNLTLRAKGVRSLAFSPDGRHLISGGNSTVKIWDAQTGAEVTTLLGGYQPFYVKSLAFSPDGRRIIWGSFDKTVEVWDAATGDEVMTLRGHEKRVFSVSFSADGKQIISSAGYGYDSEIKVWDAVSGSELMTLRGHKEPVSCIAFSPDGKHIVSGSWDGSIKVWDASTGAELMTFQHGGTVWSVAFSPDGKRVVSGGSNDVVRVFDVTTCTDVMTLRVGEFGVISVLFSPDGKRIISSGRMDTAVRIWDAETGDEVFTFHLPGTSTSSITLSPDGKTLAVGHGDTVTLLETEAPPGGYGPRQTAEAARGVVDDLYAKSGYYCEVIDKLEADETLDEPVRKLALQIANSRKWEDAEKLKKESWEMVSSPGRDIGAYEAALGKAKKANRLEANDPYILTTLGVAQYRVGAYADALETLKLLEKISADGHLESHPANVAFTAMALHQLGRGEDAQAALDRLRDLCKDKRFAENKKTQALLAEAEKLFAGEKQ